MRLSRNPGTPRKQERRKERTTDHATQILVFALSYCTISLPSHGYFNPEGLGCRSAKIKQPAFLYSVGLYSSAPSPFSQLLFVRTVLETPHTRAPVNGAERLPGEDGETQLAEAKMKQTNTKRRPGRGGAPSTTTPKHRSPPESGVGGGTAEIHEEGICLPRPGRSLGSRIAENKKNRT
ncbi:hypothetical protein EI555_007776 [Monodon monoceros]|uniref:Uncharacterized protein n=1 Tax=Monodon monoceros TaxID=40151 RepID=A0A4U1FD75_MONMO|nr:hypothetical protein EI555_007776 [Monodon monoceros]